MHTSRRQLLLTASALGLGVSGLSGLARAHGDQHQAKKTGPVRKKQKEWGIDVRRGETLRFRVRNNGKHMHEFVIGTKAENAKHAELMIRFPNMEHDEPSMAHVPPGKTGEIVWTFNRAGTFEYACLIAGHYQAGMVGSINVRAT